MSTNDLICTVRVEITLRSELHDPEGAVVRSSVHDLGYPQVLDVRSGKVYYISIRSRAKDCAISIADELCRRLLANPVKDVYRIDVVSCREERLSSTS